MYAFHLLDHIKDSVGHRIYTSTLWLVHLLVTILSHSKQLPGFSYFFYCQAPTVKENWNFIFSTWKSGKLPRL